MCARILKYDHMHIVIPTDILLVGKIVVFPVLDVIGYVDLRSVHIQKPPTVDKP